MVAGEFGPRAWEALGGWVQMGIGFFSEHLGLEILGCGTQSVSVYVYIYNNCSSPLFTIPIPRIRNLVFTPPRKNKTNMLISISHFGSFFLSFSPCPLPPVGSRQIFILVPLLCVLFWQLLIFGVELEGNWSGIVEGSEHSDESPSPSPYPYLYSPTNPPLTLS